MRFSLVLSSREPGEGEIDPDALTAMQEAFGAYGRALVSAGSSSRRRCSSAAT